MLPEASHRFENFVVGSGNRLAVAAARAVAEAPGSVYNPLFIYSGSGLGKTHLVGATGNMARQIEPSLQVEYLTLDEFVDQMHAAVAAARMESFKEKFRAVDILILDDAQFLTGKRETQSELLRLLAAWQRSGKQLILTSDRPPSEIADVDERLLTRLTGGLIVDIAPPDYETRLAILKRKCEERRISIDPAVMAELARIDFSNVRELQGALNRLSVHMAAGGGSLDPREIRRVLGLVVRTTPAPTLPDSPELPHTSESEFESFLSDMASVLAEQVKGWRVQLGEASSKWSGLGYKTASLDMHLARRDTPDVTMIVREFESRVSELKELERRAAELDPAESGKEIFRDVTRVEEAEAHLQKLLAASSPPPPPLPEFTRGGYEVGSSNELAVRVSDMVVAQPGSRYNPLFIHGPEGVGKTHLLHAIGNELVHASGGAIQVAAINAAAFVDELVTSLSTGTVDRFRARYRSVDALLVDDVQHICGKERSQDEFFHLFNTFAGAGKQIVLAADRHPKDMSGLEERLRSRFEGGVVVGVAPPDKSVRASILSAHLGKAEGVDIQRIVEYLSERPFASVRETVETAYRLRAAADAAGIPLSLDLVRTELGRSTPQRLRRTTPARQHDAFFVDREKVVWEWHDPGARLIEDLR